MARHSLSALMSAPSTGARGSPQGRWYDALMKPPATYDDLLRLPEHVVGEIIAGELIVSPRPAPPHAIATSAIGGELMGPFQFGKGGPGGWWIIDEPEL